MPPKIVILCLLLCLLTGCASTYPPYKGYVNDGVMHFSTMGSIEFFVEPNLFFFKEIE